MRFGQYILSQELLNETHQRALNSQPSIPVYRLAGSMWGLEGVYECTLTKFPRVFVDPLEQV